MRRSGKNNIEIPYSEALKELAGKLISPETGGIQEKSLEVAGFFEFVRDIWSLSYPQPSHFNLWHVKMLCDDVETAMADGKHYCAILPRGHYKSTILGHAFCIWRLLSLNRDDEMVYISNSDTMAKRHMSEINKMVRANPILKEIMRDRASNSQFTCRFAVGTRHIEITAQGVHSFKRGMHVDGGLVADDLLKDPENPLNISTLDKIEEIFNKDAMFVPNPGAPIVVIGTPMAPHDLLAKLQEDERFYSRRLPVYNPIPGIEVLAPEIRNKDDLEAQRKARPFAFATEFLLQPYISLIAYINNDDVEAVENSDLKNLNPNISHREELVDADYVVAGLDIGKKRNPSHLVIFKSYQNGNKIIQVNSTWMDNWDYIKQAEFINEITERFGIDRGYFDNTRAELEDRLLSDKWIPIQFNLKTKKQLAQIFESFIKNNKIELIKDDRQRIQITSVDNELNAPETPSGHGDSFWSVALATMAYRDYGKFGIYTVGSMQEFMDFSEKDTHVRKMEEIVQSFNDKNIKEDLGGCPICGAVVGWEPKNQLCLVCHFEKEREKFNSMLMNQEKDYW